MTRRGGEVAHGYRRERRHAGFVNFLRRAVKAARLLHVRRRVLTRGYSYILLCGSPVILREIREEKRLERKKMKRNQRNYCQRESEKGISDTRATDRALPVNRVSRQINPRLGTFILFRASLCVISKGSPCPILLAHG